MGIYLKWPGRARKKIFFSTCFLPPAEGKIWGGFQGKIWGGFRGKIQIFLNETGIFLISPGGICKITNTEMGAFAIARKIKELNFVHFSVQSLLFLFSFASFFSL